MRSRWLVCVVGAVLSWASGGARAGAMVYWAAYAGRKIQRAALDGSDIEDLVTVGLDGPADIWLDIQGGKVYWTSLLDDKIRRADVNGSNVEDVIRIGLASPLGIATAIPEPATLSLLALGGLAVMRRRRRWDGDGRHRRWLAPGITAADDNECARAGREEKKGECAMERVSLTVCCIFLIGAHVWAEDVDPPQGRGAPVSACQEWDFLTDLPPEGYYSPDGSSGITDSWGSLLYVYGQYEPAMGPGPGGAWVADVSATPFFMEILTPDLPSLGNEGRVQVTFDNTKAEPRIWVDHATGSFRVLPVPMRPNWSVTILDYALDEFLADHTIFLMVWSTEPAVVSEVVVDIIPEPATLSLLAFGGLAVMRRRRRSLWR